MFFALFSFQLLKCGTVSTNVEDFKKINIEITILYKLYISVQIYSILKVCTVFNIINFYPDPVA